MNNKKNTFVKLLLSALCLALAVFAAYSGVFAIVIPLMALLLSIYIGSFAGYAVALMPLCVLFFTGSMLARGGCIFAALTSFILLFLRKQENMNYIRCLLYGALAALAGMATAYGYLYWTLGDYPTSVLAGAFTNTYAASSAQSLVRSMGDSYLAINNIMEQEIADFSAAMSMLGDVAAQSMEIKSQSMLSLLKETLSLYAPSVLIAYSIICGSGSLLLYSYLNERRDGKKENDTALVPSLAYCALPGFILIPIILLWIISYLITLFINENMMTLYLAFSSIASVAFVFQGAGLIAMLFDRKKVRPVWKFLLLIATVPLMSGIYVIIGAIESTLNIRRYLASLDFLREKGIDPASPQAIEALRKRELELRRKAHNNKDDNDDDDKGDDL